MYVFIINPVSGNGKSRQIWQRVRSILDARHISYHFYFTEFSGHAKEIAQNVAEQDAEHIQAIVAVGGDGTMHEVVNGIAKYPDLPLGFIASGSGNDFSRGFAVPATPEEALERILAGERQAARAYDLGSYQVGESESQRGFFMNGIGIGFDGEVAKVTDASFYKPLLNRLRLGALAYVLTVIRLLFTYRTHEVVLLVDGVEHRFHDVWLMAVSNIPYYGGGMMISPAARPDDGVFHLCIVSQLSSWKLLAVFGTVFQGKHVKFREVTILTGHSIEVMSTTPMTIHGDGEIIGSTPISIRMEAGKRAIV